MIEQARQNVSITRDETTRHAQLAAIVPLTQSKCSLEPAIFNEQSSILDENSTNIFKLITIINFTILGQYLTIWTRKAQG